MHCFLGYLFVLLVAISGCFLLSAISFYLKKTEADKQDDRLKSKCCLQDAFCNGIQSLILLLISAAIALVHIKTCKVSVDSSEIKKNFIEEVKNDKDFQTFECYKWKPALKKAEPKKVARKPEDEMYHAMAVDDYIELQMRAAEKRMQKAMNDAHIRIEHARSHHAVLIKVPGGWRIETTD